jgi:hypothetical protein
VIYHFLGVRPNIPEREISVLPDLPPEWPTLSAQNIRVADSTMKASATHNGKQYEVTAPIGLRVRIGHTLPPNSTITTATFNPAAYEVRDTHRGRDGSIAFLHRSLQGGFRVA